VYLYIYYTDFIQIFLYYFARLNVKILWSVPGLLDTIRCSGRESIFCLIQDTRHKFLAR